MAKSKPPAATMMPPWEALERAIKETVKPPEPPPQAFTYKDFEKRMGYGGSKSRELLQKLIDLGYVKRSTFKEGNKPYYEYVGLMAGAAGAKGQGDR